MDKEVAKGAAMILFWVMVGGGVLTTLVRMVPGAPDTQTLAQGITMIAVLYFAIVAAIRK